MPKMASYSSAACHLWNIGLLKINMPKIAVSNPNKVGVSKYENNCSNYWTKDLIQIPLCWMILIQPQGSQWVEETHLTQFELGIDDLGLDWFGFGSTSKSSTRHDKH